MRPYKKTSKKTSFLVSNGFFLLQKKIGENPPDFRGFFGDQRFFFAATDTTWSHQGF